jgi:hypothetical protein
LFVVLKDAAGCTILFDTQNSFLELKYYIIEISFGFATLFLVTSAVNSLRAFINVIDIQIGNDKIPADDKKAGDYCFNCFGLLLKVPVWARIFISFLYDLATMNPPVTVI